MKTVKIDPDTYFLTFMANIILIVVTLLTITQSHWYTGEFFMIKHLKGIYEIPVYIPTNKLGTQLPMINVVPYDKVLTIGSFKKFMNETIPYRILPKYNHPITAQSFLPVSTLHITVKHKNVCDEIDHTGHKHIHDCKKTKLVVRDKEEWDLSS